MACPTLRTTNDMPIVQPASFESFNLVPFQINPHYLDAPLNATHQGETRVQRIEEFLEENDVPVIGLPEGTWLREHDEQLLLGGLFEAVLFERGAAPRFLKAGTDLSWLLANTPRFDLRG
jgi:dipeptidase E